MAVKFVKLVIVEKTKIHIQTVCSLDGKDMKQSSVAQQATAADKAPIQEKYSRALRVEEILKLRVFLMT